MNLISTPRSKPVHFSWCIFRVFSQLYEPLFTDNPGNRFKREGGRPRTLRSWAGSRARVQFKPDSRTVHCRVHRNGYPLFFSDFYAPNPRRGPPRRA